jgi:hypothetical protein
MEGTPLFPLPEGMLIDQIRVTKTGLVISVIATHPTSCCPLCAFASSSIKSHYRRSLRDVPCGGHQIQLALLLMRSAEPRFAEVASLLFPFLMRFLWVRTPLFHCF